MRARGTKALLVLAILAAPVAFPGAAAPAGARSDEGLGARLAGLVSEADLGGTLGISVVDATSGREIFSHHADLKLNPASNMKLVTAAAAVRELGPDFRMLTGLYGKVEPEGRVSELVLRGFGDPSLRMSDLVELAEQLADRGVRRMDRLVVDGSYFDDRILPPAFDQQPEEVAAFRAPVSAVAVERSAYVLRVLPGPEPGARARVRLAAEGYFDVDNSMTTAEAGGPDVVAVQRADGTRMKLILRGSVPTGILGIGYHRRVEQPLAYAGWAMIEALRRAGIDAADRVELGRGDDGLPLITSRKSPPVAELLRDLGKHSDNFVAEMLLKVIGAERSRPGSSERGVEALQEALRDAGVKDGAATIINGSGLFDGNRIAAAHLTALLAMMYRKPAHRAEYLASLAVGGVDGTLARRLRDLPTPRVVRAKTGTLADTIGLSGYVLGPDPERALAFSVLANDVRGEIGDSRKLADDIAGALAEHLWKE
ncbi:MAG: D-alanyl-D-alanine carboxypeptidase/D-alanyl-D-alanine-endopeptidase [Myxococcota bacterium]